MSQNTRSILSRWWGTVMVGRIARPSLTRILGFAADGQTADEMGFGRRILVPDFADAQGLALRSSRKPSALTQPDISRS